MNVEQIKSMMGTIVDSGLAIKAETYMTHDLSQLNVPEEYDARDHE